MKLLVHAQPPPAPIRQPMPDNYWIRVGQSAYFFVAWVSAYLAHTYSIQVRAQAVRTATAEVDAIREKARALRYQLNPHFLFNALNSISALVVKKHPAADDMILNLADLLRESLITDPFDDVSLERELELASLYLQIEAVRFGDRLKVAVDVPGELLSVCVPSLILQPLLENAIKYGVAASDAPVTVSVIAARADNMLTLTVRDDGPGSAADSGTSIGHRNIRDRLHARFGDAATFTARSSEHGFEAKVTIPCTRSESAEPS